MKIFKVVTMKPLTDKNLNLFPIWPVFWVLVFFSILTPIHVQAQGYSAMPYGQNSGRLNPPGGGQYTPSQNQPIPGIDISRLSKNGQNKLFSTLKNEQCNCGCGLNMLQCRIQDPACTVSLNRAQQVLSMIESSGRPQASPYNAGQFPQRSNNGYPAGNYPPNNQQPAPYNPNGPSGTGYPGNGNPPNYQSTSPYNANKPPVSPYPGGNSQPYQTPMPNNQPYSPSGNFSSGNSGQNPQYTNISVTRPDGTNMNLQSPPCSQNMIYELQQSGMSTADIQEVIRNMCNQ